MVKLFGLGRLPKARKSPPNQQSLTDLPYLENEGFDSEQQNHAPRERERRKVLRTRKRLVPTARSPELLRDRHPMYQYALNEYSQTVVSGSSNDDGRKFHTDNQNAEPPSPASAVPAAPSMVSATLQQPRRIPDPPSMSSTQVEPSATNHRLDRQGSGSSTASSLYPESYHSHNNTVAESTKAAAQSIVASAPSSPSHNPLRSRFEDEMPTPAYEEYYGDAYTGAPMKYIYPAGYQSMRPRSWPWRLSMLITVVFTWLSIFIVGHCSDQADADLYYNAEIEDDTLMIDIRWCGSRPLYLMWVASMLINGLAAAYCAVIGYVKCRDFAVANTRAQPVSVLWPSPVFSPGKGKNPPTVSDYYVRLGPLDEETASSVSGAPYRPTIYQADGEPQFWGQEIYRPTQAAVAVTSR